MDEIKVSTQQLFYQKNHALAEMYAKNFNSWLKKNFFYIFKKY